jgi:hypothetical protein
LPTFAWNLRVRLAAPFIPVFVPTFVSTRVHYFSDFLHLLSDFSDQSCRVYTLSRLRHSFIDFPTLFPRGQAIPTASTRVPRGAQQKPGQTRAQPEPGPTMPNALSTLFHSDSLRHRQRTTRHLTHHPWSSESTRRPFSPRLANRHPRRTSPRRFTPRPRRM